MIDDESMNKRPLDEMTEHDDNKSDSVEPMVRLRGVGTSHVSRLVTYIFSSCNRMSNLGFQE